MLLVGVLHCLGLLLCWRHPAPADFGAAAWKLHARHRRQLAGSIHHHMRHWNRPVVAAPAAGHARQGSPGPGRAGSGSDSEDEGGRHLHRAHLRGVAGSHAHRPSHGHLLSTSLILDREVFRRLKNVVAALEALSLQVSAMLGGSAVPLGWCL